MRRIFAMNALVLLAASGLLLFTPGKAWVAGDKDPVQPKTVWKGEIRQEDEVFPTTIYFKSRDKDRIKGEIHFGRGGQLNKLTFEGNVVDGRTVVWITDRKEGNVTYPGLYIGRIDGKSISGTWQVPSAIQYDRFTVKLVE